MRRGTNVSKKGYSQYANPRRFMLLSRDSVPVTLRKRCMLRRGRHSTCQRRKVSRKSQCAAAESWTMGFHIYQAQVWCVDAFANSLSLRSSDFAARFNLSIYCCVLYLCRDKIVEIGTLSFRWIIHFWYFCFRIPYKSTRSAFESRKLRVPTSEGSVLLYIHYQM